MLIPGHHGGENRKSLSTVVTDPDLADFDDQLYCCRTCWGRLEQEGETAPRICWCGRWMTFDHTCRCFRTNHHGCLEHMCARCLESHVCEGSPPESCSEMSVTESELARCPWMEEASEPSAPGSDLGEWEKPKEAEATSSMARPKSDRGGGPPRRPPNSIKRSDSTEAVWGRPTSSTPDMRNLAAGKAAPNVRAGGQAGEVVARQPITQKMLNAVAASLQSSTEVACFPGPPRPTQQAHVLAPPPLSTPSDLQPTEETCSWACGETVKNAEC